MIKTNNTAQMINNNIMSIDEINKRRIELELEVEINKDLYNKKIIDKNTYEIIFKELIKEQKSLERG